MSQDFIIDLLSSIHDLQMAYNEDYKFDVVKRLEILKDIGAMFVQGGADRHPGWQSFNPNLYRIELTEERDLYYAVQYALSLTKTITHAMDEETQIENAWEGFLSVISLLSRINVTWANLWV